MKTSEDFVKLAHENLGVFDDSDLVKRKALSKSPFKQTDDNLPFLETMADGLINSLDFENPNEGEINSVTQFILTGSPSSGKSTELRRIGKELYRNKIGDGGTIIHLCSLQNSSSMQKAIHSTDDLWDWIMKSHESRTIANQRYSFEEFNNLHKRFEIKPIMLIDTVDLLIYGKIGESNKEIVGYWIEIIEMLKKEDFTVVWSCRKFEYQNMKKDNHSLKETLTQIEIPMLDDNDIKELFKNHKRVEREFFALLGMVFPIVVGYKNNQNKWSRVIEKQFEDLHKNTMALPLNLEYIKHKHPVKWIASAECLDGRIATDFLYDGLVKKLVRHVHRLYRFTEEEVQSSWKEIELQFFNSAIQDPEISRIQVDSDKLEDLKRKTCGEAVIKNAIRFGILSQNKRDSPYEMSHQLFAEFCVWKHRGLKEGEENWIDKFPSCIFRSAGGANKGDDDILNEGKTWFYPFMVFNEDLAKKYANETFGYYPQWEKYGKFAHGILKTGSNTMDLNKTQRSDRNGSSGKKVDDIRNITDEKILILNGLNRKEVQPFIVNGPAGVGKSHLSYVWMDKKASKDEGWRPLESDEEREIGDDLFKEKVYFMTLSQKLKLQMIEKVKEYYALTQEPFEFRSWAIPEYIEQMERTLNLNHDPLTFDRFKDKWMRSSAGNTILQRAGKVSPSALWNEFEHKMIDKFGEFINKKEYVKDTEIFDNDRKPHEVAERFWEWADKNLNQDYPLARRAGKCIKKIFEVVENGTLSERENILSLQPNILVLDEIQDLPYQVILLMLIMQDGTQDQVMMCGDDEQTLELIQFDWEKTFERIDSAIYEIKNKENYKKVESERLIENWSAGPNLKGLAKDKENLTVVERCVPDIVELIKESWKTSVSKKIIPFVEDGHKSGAGYIEAGEISKSRKEGNKVKNIRDGVDIYKEVTEKQLIEAAREIYDNGHDIAILLPNKTLHDDFSKKLSEEEIKLELWTPRLIKGLEYPIVIAINPWDIHREHFQNVMNRVEMNNYSWEQIENYYVTTQEENKQLGSGKLKGSHKKEKAMKSIELIVKQRRRHANIMLSRAQNRLIIASLDNYRSDKEMIHTGDLQFKTGWNDDQFPKHFIMKNHMNKNHGIKKLIERLYLIILSAETSDDRRQVSLKAGHILQTLIKMDRIKHSLPFQILSQHWTESKKKDKDKIKIFDNAYDELEDYIGENKDSFIPWLELKNYLADVTKTVGILGENEMLLPVNLVQTFLSKINSFITKFTRIDLECFDTEEDFNQLEKQREKISKYIQEYVFGGFYSETLRRASWIEHAQTLDIETYQVTLDLRQNHNLKFKLIPKDQILENNDSIDSMEAGTPRNDSHINRFWENGLRYLSQIPKEHCEDIAEHMVKGSDKGYIPIQGIKFFNRLILELANKVGTRARPGDIDNDILNICKYSHVLEERWKKENEMPNLYEKLNSSVRERFAKIMISNLGKGFVNDCLVKNANGLYTIFEEFISNKKNSDPEDLKKLVKLGEDFIGKLDKTSSNQSVAEVWENPKVLQLTNYCVSKIENFQYNNVNLGRSRKVVAIFSDILKAQPGSFGENLRLELNRKAIQNIIEFHIAESCSVNLAISITEKESILSRLIEHLKSLPLLGKIDSQKWILSMTEGDLSSRLIRIPYRDLKEDLAGLNQDKFFGRLPGRFAMQSAWNKILIEAFDSISQEVKIELQNQNHAFELEYFSIWDEVYTNSPERKDAPKHLMENVSNIDWRKDMLKINGKNGPLNRVDKGILHALNGLEIVQILDNVVEFLLGLKHRIILRIENITRYQLDFETLLSKQKTLEESGFDIFSDKEGDDESWETSKTIERIFTQKMPEVAQLLGIKGGAILEDIVTELQKELKLAKIADEKSNFNPYHFVVDFIEFFHGYDEKGFNRFKSTKTWGLLQDEFLMYHFPHASKCVELSLYKDFEVMKSFIKLIQSFGQEEIHNIDPSYNIDNIDSYKVKRFDYIEQTYNFHQIYLDKFKNTKYPSTEGAES